MGDRCTGHCCRVFTLPYEPVKLAQVCNEPGRVTDGPYVADMVIYLGSGSPDDLGLGPGVRPKWADDGKDREPSHFYTCRHFDGRNCTVYASRPEVCRTYPEGRECVYGACSWDAARCGAVDRGECAPAVVGLEGMRGLPADWWRHKAPEKWLVSLVESAQRATVEAVESDQAIDQATHQTHDVAAGGADSSDATASLSDD